MDLLGTLRDRALIRPMVALDLCRLARRMLEHQHGGTILIIAKSARPIGVVHHPSYGSRPMPSGLLMAAATDHNKSRGGDIRPAGMPDGQWVRLLFEYEQKHDDALDFVARLTAVDGALLLEDDLSVVGFGTTISAARKRIRLVHEDPRKPGAERSGVLTDLGGNRHRSAAHFCIQQRGLGLAIVASQDGDIAFLARRKDGRVHVLRPYELGAGV
jgi:hypothetical protein